MLPTLSSPPSLTLSSFLGGWALQVSSFYTIVTIWGLYSRGFGPTRRPPFFEKPSAPPLGPGCEPCSPRNIRDLGGALPALKIGRNLKRGIGSALSNRGGKPPRLHAKSFGWQAPFRPLRTGAGPPPR